MIDITSQTNYKLADTTQEVLNLTPTPAGQLAIAKDTHNLFISTGSDWQQVAKSKSYGIQHVINAQHSLNSKPVCEFDSRDMSSLKTRNNRAPEDGESVSNWFSQVSTHKLFSDGGERAPTYVNSDHNVVIVKQTSDPFAEGTRVDNETPLVMHAIAAYLGSRSGVTD